MKYCKRCGTPCEDGDAACRNCGYRFDQTSGTRDYNSNFSQQTDMYSNHPHTNGMAVASLVLGLIGILFLPCRGIGLITSVLAIIFGAISWRSIRASRGAETGNGMAIAGLVLGIVSVALAVLVILLAAVGAIALGSLLNGSGSLLGGSGNFSV